MRRLKVIARDLVFALQGRAKSTVHYLDIETGEVIPVFGFNRDRVLEMVRTDSDRYLRLAPRTGGRDYEVMSRFVETVADNRLRKTLQDTIIGEYAFRRFRAELDDHPDQRERWERYRAVAVSADLREKLNAAGIELELTFD